MNAVMVEIAVGELRVSDVGSRVVMISDGGTFDGRLDSVWTSWDKYSKPGPSPMTRVVVESGSAKLELSKLPCDFRLQIERSAS